MATSPPSPLESLWTPQALVTAVLAGEGLAVVTTLASPPDDWWVQFGLTSLLVQWVTLSGLGAIYLFRRRLSRLATASMAWVCLGLLLVASCLVAVVAHAMFPAAAGQESLFSFASRLLGIALVVGLLALVAFQNYLGARRAALRAKQAELEALQARVHPHFLFNTLNSAAALVHARPDDAERVLLDLSDLFRAALSEPGWVPLQQELDLCRRYLAIEQLRFGERLRAQWDVAEGTHALQIPLLAVQPLVENAVAHGFEDASQGKRLRVEVREAGDALYVSVGNAVAPASQPRVPGHGIGLAAVRARIESVTQGKGRLEAGVTGRDFIARIVIPHDAMPGSSQATIS